MFCGLEKFTRWACFAVYSPLASKCCHGGIDELTAS